MAFIIVGTISFGCASTREPIVLAPVGPPPSVRGNRSPDGSLVVYSALDIHQDNPDLDQQHHSSYEIYSSDGNFLKRVRNIVGTYLPDPVTVSLPPGTYKIEARASVFGPVVVPVLIEAGKTTFVHLDGSELSSGAAGPTSDLVRLPDGLVVGWRAEPHDKKE